MNYVGIFFGHLVYFTIIWNILWPFGTYILWLFGMFFPVLVCCTKENLATLVVRCYKDVQDGYRCKYSQTKFLKRLKFAIGLPTYKGFITWETVSLIIVIIKKIAFLNCRTLCILLLNCPLKRAADELPYPHTHPN
jgi:hypothetical protein